MQMRGAIAVVMTACVGLQGCRGGPPPSETPEQPATGEEYVALGDSYTAAPETGPGVGDDGCLRSRTNYPHLAAASLGAALTDVSCGGATSDALVDPYVSPGGERVPPQLDALSESTDVVTVSIGANDSDLFGSLVTTCVGLAAAAPNDDHPCSDGKGKPANPAVTTEIAAMGRQVEARLVDVTRRAPDADVLVVGYPTIFPPSGACNLAPLAAGDYEFAHALVAGINEALRSAAKTAGVEYVDIAAGTADHHICASDPWIAGAAVPRGHAVPWHPYPEEQRFVARRIEAALR